MDNRVKDLMERGFSELTPDCFDQIMQSCRSLRPGPKSLIGLTPMKGRG